MDTGFADVILLSDVYDGNAARVTRWLHRIGDVVAANEPLVEIETDKVMVEIASPAAGRLSEISKNDGDVTGTGDLLGRIEIGAEAKPVSPAVRSLLTERGLSLSAVPGTGKDGRITARDVERSNAAELKSHRVPHTAMRRRIAENMSASVRTAPHVTAVFETDMSAVVAHRAACREEFARRGVNLSFTAYFLAACAAAFRAVPEINSRFHDDALEVFDDLNIGVGTALGGAGLVVPVMKGVQDLDLFGIAERLGVLLERARAGRLDPGDVRGGTLTITNHGVSGSLFATPIIHQPQCAIVGVGKLERRPSVVAIDGVEQIQMRPKCFVSLTIDHRAIDGFQANGFLTAWVGCLEAWPAVA